VDWRGTVSLVPGADTRVRLHWTVLLFILFELLHASSEGWPLARFAASLAALASAIALRQWGQRIAARGMPASARPEVIGPFGGLDPIAVPDTPEEERSLARGGLAISGALALLLLPYVVLTDQVSSFLLRIEPAAGAPDLLAIFWAAQFDLLVFQAIPALPFDGGRILFARLRSARGSAEALERIILVSRGCAVAGVLLWLMTLGHGGNILLAAAFCWVGAAIEQRRAIDGDGGESWRPTPERGPGRLFGWWEQRAEIERARRRESEARERVAESAELDQLLDRVHREGIDSLSRAERRSLEKLGRRMRDRKEDPPVAP
jgi:Zn-dependent protease